MEDANVVSPGNSKIGLGRPLRDRKKDFFLGVGRGLFSPSHWRRGSVGPLAALLPLPPPILLLLVSLVMASLLLASRGLGGVERKATTQFGFRRVPWGSIPRRLLDPASKSNLGDKWIVVTTINPPTAALRSLAAVEGWKLVVVGDSKTPPDWRLEGAIFLDLETQRKLGFRIHDLLPLGSYARKNLGYLFAIQHGAKVIFEADDDNVLLSRDLGKAFDVDFSDFRSKQMLEFKALENRSVVNPYVHFGQPAIWPRGLPLDAVGANKAELNYQRPASWRLPLIKQGLANGDPDVDAIFRLTRTSSGKKIEVEFDANAPPVCLPPTVMCPFNSQNTLFHRDAFWALFLPMTTSLRVCDIWRGYWAQRLLQDVGAMLAFYPPTARQDRNPHNYTDDFESERDLYSRGRPLVDFLLTWRSKEAVFFDRALELSHAMAQSAFWGFKDVELTAAWLADLISVGYEPPELKETMPAVGASSAQVAAKKKILRKKSTVRFVAQSLPSSNLAAPKVLQKGRSQVLQEWMRGREALRHIVLVINYNHARDAPKSVWFWRSVYGRIFDHVVIVSGAGESDPALQILKAPVTKDSVPMRHPRQPHITISTPPGMFSYSALRQIVEKYPQAAGFLWTNDDLIVNYWNLVQANQSKIWFLGPTHPEWSTAALNGSNFADPAAYWWLSDHTRMTFQAAMAALPKEYKGRFDRAILPRTNVLVKAVSDAFYLPQRHARAAAELANHFVQASVWSEVAIPSILFCLDPPGEFDKRALRDIQYFWNRQRINPVRNYHVTKAGFHPWKFLSAHDPDMILAAMSQGDPLL